MKTAQAGRIPVLIWIFSGSPVILLGFGSYGKNRPKSEGRLPPNYRRIGSVARESALRPGGCRVDPQPSHTKDFKRVLTAVLLGAEHWEIRARTRNWSVMRQHNVTGWNITSCVWWLIFQWDSSLKVSTTCHIQTPCDMIERLLKATLNPNKMNINLLTDCFSRLKLVRWIKFNVIHALAQICKRNDL